MTKLARDLIPCGASACAGPVLGLLRCPPGPALHDTMNTAYCFAVDLPQPLPAALETLRAALAAEQMGVVSEFDVQATLKAKLGLESHPQRLLGVCSPKIAHMLLGAEPDIAALLPCGCGLSEATPGHTRVVLQDPRVIAAASGKPEVRAACELASAAVRRVADRLADTRLHAAT